LDFSCVNSILRSSAIESTASDDGLHLLNLQKYLKPARNPCQYLFSLFILELLKICDRITEQAWGPFKRALRWKVELITIMGEMVGPLPLHRKEEAKWQARNLAK
jgi:hypothetical protein